MLFDRAELSDVAGVGVRWVRFDDRFHRQVLNPGDDISGLPEDIQQQIKDHWTPERVSEWQAMMDAD